MTERIVYKYPLNPGMTTLSLPTRATLLHVAYQGEQLQLWALVNPASPIDERTVLVLGTGHRYNRPGDLRHINTFLVEDGAYVFHAFEVTP